MRPNPDDTFFQSHDHLSGPHGSGRSLPLTIRNATSI